MTERNPYSMTTPCGACPFRRTDGAVRLYAARIRRIASVVLSPAGGSFPCHKTVDYDADDDDTLGEDNCRPMRADEVHCAGALIFAEKNGNQTQLMRIASRLRLYDPRKLTGHDEVFDSLREMLASAIDSRPARHPKKSSGSHHERLVARGWVPRHADRESEYERTVGRYLLRMRSAQTLGGGFSWWIHELAGRGRGVELASGDARNRIRAAVDCEARAAELAAAPAPRRKEAR